MNEKKHLARLRKLFKYNDLSAKMYVFHPRIIACIFDKGRGIHIKRLNKDEFPKKVDLAFFIYEKDIDISLYKKIKKLNSVNIVVSSRKLQLLGKLAHSYINQKLTPLGLNRFVYWITHTIAIPGLVGIDYIDIEHIFKHGGQMNFLRIACKKKSIVRLIKKKLVNYHNCKNCFIRINGGVDSGGLDITLEEISLIGETVGSCINPNANLLCGAGAYYKLKGKVEVLLYIGE